MNRDDFIVPLVLLAAVAVLLPSVPAAEPLAPVHQATGFKITEPAATTVSIWTRVTRDAERTADGGPLPITHIFHRTTGAELPLRDNAAYPNGRPAIAFPPGADLGSIRGAAIGAAGQTRVRYRADLNEPWAATEWRDADAQRDFTAVFQLSALRPRTRYRIEVEARPRIDAAVTSTVVGDFVTAPAAGDATARVSFCVMTCQQYEDRDRADGFAIYPAMLDRRPDFFVNTGDAVYYDHGPVHALTVEFARYHWARMYGFATLRDFHRRVGSYFMKDDHDVLTNDSHPGDRTGDFTFADGLRVFREQTAPTEPPYRTFRWGRHLQIWLLEGRDFRSTQAEDRTHTPTILGAAQIAWLERTLAASDATFRLVITPTPMVGPDRPSKDDNLSNPGYTAEGTRLRALLARHDNLTVITGDRHWQYVSRDKTTGLEEWSVGAASDAHAGGWNEDTPRPEHRFLRTKHGGFLSGEITPASGTASATFTLRLHDTAGKTVFESSCIPGERTRTTPR